MDATYKRNEMNVYRIAVQLEQILKKEQSPKAAEQLQRLSVIEEQLQTRKFRMAVVGEFNRGKSSFINVLLGKKILPEDVLAATAAINRVTYGETPRAYLIRKDGSRDSQGIPVEELASYVTKLTESSAKAAAGIREAVVEYPTMLCYHDVDLIDTPGMNDMDDMNAVTVNQLEDIDLAVVAINAQYPYSETENRFVVKLLENRKVCQIIFVITHFDAIRERERKRLTDFLYSRIQNNVLEELNKRYEPEDWIFQKYHAIFDDLRLYGVSSVDGMRALESNDMELYEKSGFLRLSKELPQVILSSKSIHMLDNALILLEEMIGECERKCLDVGKGWERRHAVSRSLCSISALAVEELEELAEEEIRDEKFWEEGELWKREIVENFLDSLGGIKEMTIDAIRGAMLPVMRQEFQRINRYYQDRKKHVLRTIYEREWVSALSRFVGEVNDKIRGDPQLISMLKTANGQLFSLPGSLFMMKNTGSLSLPAAGMQPEETVFCWMESPINVVLQTEKNQSILPGLQRIVDASINECIGKVKDSVRKDFEKQIWEIREILDSYMGFLNECLAGCDSDVAEANALMTELASLKKECGVLHKKLNR